MPIKSTKVTGIGDIEDWSGKKVPFAAAAEQEIDRAVVTIQYTKLPISQLSLPHDIKEYKDQEITNETSRPKLNKNRWK